MFVEIPQALERIVSEAVVDLPQRPTMAAGRPTPSGSVSRRAVA
jgi:hypothetical protein